MCSFSGATCTSRDVTMQITFLTRKSALIYRRDLRQRVASLTLNCNGVLAIRAYTTSFISNIEHNNITPTICSQHWDGWKGGGQKNNLIAANPQSWWFVHAL